MASSHDHEPRLSSEEHRFVKWCATQYAPPALTASRQVAFDHALESRLSRRRGRGRSPLIVAVATVGALGLWLMFHGPSDLERTGQKERLRSHDAVGSVLFGLALDEPDELADESLPEDYLVLSQLLSTSSEDR